MLSLLFTALAFGFACGAVPFGYFVGRFRGIDIRQAGSGNIGFTNVARVLGWPYAAPVLLLDFAKGLLPTAFVASITLNYLVPAGDAVLLPRLFGSGLILLKVTAGLGAIVGHMFTPVLRFRGGKGVATTAGVIVALSPLAFAVCLLAFGCHLFCLLLL